MRRLVLCVALILAGCSRATSEPHSVSLDKEFTLQPGQSVTVAGTAVSITLTQVNDSRCPSDVQCITAGEALSILQLAGAQDERTDTLRINKPPKETTYGGYRIAVVSVMPYPLSSRTPATKSVTLVVKP